MSTSSYAYILQHAIILHLRSYTAYHWGAENTCRTIRIFTYYILFICIRWKADGFYAAAVWIYAHPWESGNNYTKSMEIPTFFSPDSESQSAFGKRVEKVDALCYWAAFYPPVKLQKKTKKTPHWQLQEVFTVNLLLIDSESKFLHSNVCVCVCVCIAVLVGVGRHHEPDVETWADQHLITNQDTKFKIIHIMTASQ